MNLAQPVDRVSSATQQSRGQLLAASGNHRYRMFREGPKEGSLVIHRVDAVFVQSLDSLDFPRINCHSVPLTAIPIRRCFPSAFAMARVYTASK